MNNMTRPSSRTIFAVFPILAICLLLTPLLAMADGLFEGYWYFDKALAREKQRSEFLQDTTFTGSRAQLHMLQDGLQVSGTWSITTAAGPRSGALKGVVQADTLQLYLCSDSAAADAAAVCPNYPADFDYLVMHGSYVAWYLHTKAGFERYLTLEHRATETKD